MNGVLRTPWLYLCAGACASLAGAVTVPSEQAQATVLFDGWREPPPLADMRDRVAGQVRILQASSLFEMPAGTGPAGLPGADVEGADKAPGPPAFPDILAAVSVHKDMYILVALDAGILQAREGQSLPGGWVVDAITLYQVTLSLDGEQVTRRIIAGASDGEAQRQPGTGTAPAPPTPQRDR